MTTINSLQQCKIKGSLIPKGHLSATIRSTLILSGKISKPKVLGGVEYDGSYSVVPKLEEQILPTKNKVLLSDMTIKSIPIHETRNDSGGYTLHIAKEL